MPRLPTRKIGNTEVTAMGYGAMGIAASYGHVMPDEDRFQVRTGTISLPPFLDALYDRGCTNWDTAISYGDSEELLGRWFARTGKRQDIFLATKVGAHPPLGKTVDGDPAYIREAFEKSVSRLGVDRIDLWYLHRADPTVSIEKSISAMAEFVKAGRVKYLGLSEVSASTLRRAHAVHPISALQVEYSPFTLDIEDPRVGLLAAARELGVTVVAYSPLGRGLLTGKYKGPEDFEATDFRRRVPRFAKANFPRILQVAHDLAAVGAAHIPSASAGQVALAWLLAQGEDVIPIPGTRSIPNLDANLGALELGLGDEEVRAVRGIAEAADVPGDRYPPGLQEVLFADTPPL
ncbi:Aldo/keto reductase [Dentipellis sp. KUC8613]|nr:Aldo/keto reductase [Dentipellis sp. KUC8613]